MTIDLNALKSRVLVGDIGTGEMDALLEVVAAAWALIDDRETVGRNGDSVISGSAVIRLETALAEFTAAARGRRMKRWNAFGHVVSFQVVIWSTFALVSVALHRWGDAEVIGIVAWVFFIAQYQWGRA